MKKKILVLGMAFVLLFSAVAFGAAACRFYDPSCTELLASLADLETRLDALEEENRVLREQVALWEYRADAIRELREFADARGEENFRLVNWNIILSYIANVAGVINEAETKYIVRTIRDEAKENIGSVRPYSEEFVLRILDEEITVVQGEDISVNVEFVNKSRGLQEIFFDSFFHPQIPNYLPNPEDPVGDPGPPIRRVLINNETLRFPRWIPCSLYCEWGTCQVCGGGTLCDLSPVWGGWRLSVGTHELAFVFAFWLNCAQMSPYFHHLRVFSNTITITVLENIAC